MMNIPKNALPITLTRTQWVYIAVTLLVVLPAVICFAFKDRIYDSYLHEFVGPKLEHEFGFKSERQSFVSGNESYDVFLLRSVISGSKLDKARFRAGDIPVG